MRSPLISVVVPTRDRPDTLAATLRALSHHKSDRIEFVVQDNSAGPLTAGVVAEAAKRDPRVRYSRSPHPTSQRHNFELGLQAARGDYMGIIGDDDGFCAGSLDWLVSQLEGNPVDAVRWTLVFYVWPTLSTDNVGFINLYAVQCYGENYVTSAKPTAEAAVKAGTIGSWDNILVYHGLIARAVYDRVRQKTDGIFFAYPIPDLYAHSVLPFFCDRVLLVNDIVSIYGTSGHSAGASWTRAPEKSGAAAAPGNLWINETAVDPVATALPFQAEIRTLRYHDLAAYKLAEAHDMLGGAVVDQERWIKAIIAEIRNSPWQMEAWFTASEKAPYDAAVFAAVRAEFTNVRVADVARPKLRQTADPRIPALRIADVDPALRDDVEGACLAIAQVTGDGPNRYNPVTSGVRAGSSWLTGLKKAAVHAQRMAPVLCSAILASPLMPRPLWRLLKVLKKPADKRSKTLQDSLDAMTLAHAGRASGPKARQGEPA